MVGQTGMVCSVCHVLPKQKHSPEKDTDDVFPIISMFPFLDLVGGLL